MVTVNYNTLYISLIQIASLKINTHPIKKKLSKLVHNQVYFEKSLPFDAFSRCCSSLGSAFGCFVCKECLR